MKETVNVNIAGQAFVIDDDAYLTLSSYLRRIKSRISPNDTDTMSDIESRIADILREKLSSSMMVVTIDMVRDAMRTLGRPEDFGEEVFSAEQQAGNYRSEPRRLYRSRTNRSLAGICGGIAEYFEGDASLIRLLTLLLILFGGLSIWIYIILWVIIPEEPASRFDMKNNKTAQ